MHPFMRRLGIIVFWLGWPGYWLYFRWSRRARVLVVRGGQILVLQGWTGSGKWGLPGGGLHRGEDPATGAARELAEETGLVVDPAALRPLSSGTYRGNGFRYICHYFVVEISGAPVLQRQPFEIAAVAWLEYVSLTPRTTADDVLTSLARYLAKP